MSTPGAKLHVSDELLIDLFQFTKVDPSSLKVKNYTKEELAKMSYEERQKPYVCESKLS